MPTFKGICARFIEEVRQTVIQNQMLLSERPRPSVIIDLTTSAALGISIAVAGRAVVDVADTLLQILRNNSASLCLWQLKRAD